MPKQSKEISYVRNKIMYELDRNRAQLAFFEAGLSDQQIDVLTRYYIRKQSRHEISMALYCSEVTISRIVKRSCNKLYNYFTS